MWQMMFSPDRANEVVTGGEHGQLRVHDLRQPEQAVRHVDAHDGHVASLHASPVDRDEFVSAGRDARIVVWNRNSLDAPVRHLTTPAPVRKVRYAVSSALVADVNLAAVGARLGEHVDDGDGRGALPARRRARAAAAAGTHGAAPRLVLGARRSQLARARPLHHRARLDAAALQRHARTGGTCT